MNTEEIATAAESLTREGKHIVTTDASMWAPFAKRYKDREKDIIIETDYYLDSQDFEKSTPIITRASFNDQPILYYDPNVTYANFYLENSEFENHLSPLAAKKLLLGDKENGY